MLIQTQNASINDDTEKGNIVTVELSTHIFAQGRFIKRLNDGRIMIECKGNRYIGHWIKRQKRDA